MSIINLEKTFENGQLVYCNLDNKIIECYCLSTTLYKYLKVNYNNENLRTFLCDKVKVITIYDIYKNIIYEPIQTDLCKDSIKIGTILENFKKDIYFFKTFIGAFIINNKLNGIKYYINYKGMINKFLYDNIELLPWIDTKIFNIYNNEGIHIYTFMYKKNYLIFYENFNYEDVCTIYNDFIDITKRQYQFYQTICFNTKNLKIFKVDKYHKDIEYINEERNDNNEIIYYNEYNKNKLKENFYSNNTNPPFSKPLRKDCIELLNNYKKNITNYIKTIKFCFKKEKIVHNNLLLNYKLEMINSK